ARNVKIACSATNRSRSDNFDKSTEPPCWFNDFTKHTRLARYTQPLGSTVFGIDETTPYALCRHQSAKCADTVPGFQPPR
ncbi:MAG: hypothetical protein M3478_13600, partial [Planctomycetota bacterium]|nr:hypothetical protein [Planctomycetota bacterium]